MDEPDDIMILFKSFETRRELILIYKFYFACMHAWVKTFKL